ncbi:MAG TPA: hypothetical protein V6C78_06875 [Crinalium sp.]|jgi:uncharacterized phage infection (PIP) family protein YhgE
MTAKSEHKTDHKNQQAEGFDIQALIKLLQGNLVEVDTDEAIAQIDQYQSALQKSDDEGLGKIANELKELKKHLKNNHGDAAKLAEVLTQLGEETNKFAADLEKEEKSDVQKLSKALTQAGRSLEKEAGKEHSQENDKAHKDNGKAHAKEQSHDDEEESPDVDALLETLHGDVTAVEPEEGIQVIDQWLAVLKVSKEDGVKEIASHLQQLKKLLKLKKADPAEISETLTQLGEETESFGADAPRGLKGPVQKLGKALVKAGKSIK